jgi:hypothetical protein
MKQGNLREKFKLLLEYAIFGCSLGEPRIYVVQFYIDWDARSAMGRLRRRADHGHARCLGRIHERTEDQAQQIAGAGHPTVASDTRSAQTDLR